MILPSNLPRTKADPVDVDLLNGNHLSRGKCRDTKGINDVVFRQSHVLAIGGSFVTKHRRKRNKLGERGIQVRLALHRALRDLVQVPTDTSHLKPDSALMDLVVTALAQAQQVRQGIFSALLPKNNVVGLQSAGSFAALLAGVAISPPAGDAQIFIEPGRVLVAGPGQGRIGQPGNVYLAMLDHYLADR